MAVMPELPEVQALAGALDERLRGQQLTNVQLGSLSALKTYDPPLSVLAGATLTGTSRRGKYLVLHFADADGVPVQLVIHLSRAGWVHWRESAPATLRPGRGPVALRLGFADGTTVDITEAGTRKRLALHVVADADVVTARLGPDALAIDRDEFGSLLRVSRQLKTLLRDQSVLCGIGNAYSDEILYRARLSPYAQAGSLSDEQVTALYEAMGDVLREATEQAGRAGIGDIKSEKRQGLRVHGRAGKTCEECGSVIAEVRLADSEFQYCPGCQTGGKLLSDRRMSRLLK